MNNENESMNSSSTSEMKTDGIIYIIQSPVLNAIKIGKTLQDVKKLINRYVTAYGNELIITVFDSDNIHYDESKIHWLMADYHIRCELFDLESLFHAIKICSEITGSEVKTIKYKGNLTKPLNPDQCPEIIKEKNKRTLGVEEITSKKVEIAAWLLNICGFDDVADEKIIMKDKFLKNILTNKHIMEEKMAEITKIFNDKRLLVKWELKQILGFINGIFDNMYGFKISVAGRTKADRDNLVIKYKRK